MPADQPDPLNPSKKLYTYEESARPFQAPQRSARHLESINWHIERHIGAIGGVFHEKVSDQVHVDVIMVPPTEKIPECTLVTSGMSDQPMISPDDPKKPAHAEVLIRLPADWPLPEKPGWKKEENFWPIRLVKLIARFPHKYGAFLWVGHTLDNGQPAAPWSRGTTFNAAFLAPSRSLPEAFENLEITAEKTIKFLAVYPVYAEESALARKEGAEALWSKFVEHQISDVVDSKRKNLVTGEQVLRKTSWWDRLRGR